MKGELATANCRKLLALLRRLDRSGDAEALRGPVLALCRWCTLAEVRWVYRQVKGVYAAPSASREDVARGIATALHRPPSTTRPRGRLTRRRNTSPAACTASLTGPLASPE
jgi:hypothetical protein